MFYTQKSKNKYIKDRVIFFLLKSCFSMILVINKKKCKSLKFLMSVYT